MSKNIYFIGMMGSGKSTIAKELVKKLNCSYLDADDYLVEKYEFDNISEIFETKGEEFFRNLEKEVLEEISSFEKHVIATGGGVILDDLNSDLMKQTGIIIYLESSIKNLVKNLQTSTHRPLLNDVELEERLEEIFKKRITLYENAADVVVDVSYKNIDKIVDDVMLKIGDKIENFNN